MIITAKEVKPLKNYLLWVRFRNDEVKIFNCNLLFWNKLYKPLMDKEYFKKVYIDEMGVISWCAGIDINPYKLYEESMDIKCFNSDNHNSIRLDRLHVGYSFYYDKEMTLNAVVVRNEPDSDQVIVETEDGHVRAEDRNIEVYVDLSEE